MNDYPHDLEAFARSAPDGPWLYTGALENYPGLIERISSRKTLWGNNADVLRRIRDPLLTSNVLRNAGICTPEVRLHPPAASDSSWLQKPRRGAGGSGVHWWPGPASRCAEHSSGSDVYYQALIKGRACSAVFVAAAGRALLLGVTEQLVGVDWTAAAEFGYCGSLGAPRLDERLLRDITQAGRVLAEHFPLRGLFGVDGIAAGGRFFPVEVNPRYTASVEIVERLHGLSAIAAHAAACRHDRLPPRASSCPDV